MTNCAFLRGPETWTPEQRGRALHMIYVLANTPSIDWRTTDEIYAGLSEFRDPPATEDQKR